jgi:hypothetical protein
MTNSLTATQDFQDVINECIHTLQTNDHADTDISFRHNLRIAAMIYGTNEEVRVDRNANVIKNILAAIGYTAKDTERWFEAVEVQFGLRESVSFDAPVFAAA